MNFTFGKKNYQLLIAGVIVMAIGFVLMSGGGSEDPNVFSDAIFNTQRLTIGPILILTGLVIEIFAILYKPKED
tara:strand:+ start:483 stop:704 length:222 start_codon:yes stop_codon:yes gene_type:complete